jgi:hypothetical protein
MVERVEWRDQELVVFFLPQASANWAHSAGPVTGNRVMFRFIPYILKKSLG